MNQQQKLPNAITMLNHAGSIYQKAFGKFLLVGIIALIPLELVRAFETYLDPIIYFALAIVAVILLFSGELTLYYLAADHNLHIGQAWKLGLKKFFPFLWTSIIVGLATVAGYLLIIPGFIFSIWFSLTSAVVAFEHISSAAAMARSRDYVKGRFWEVFRKLLLIGVIAGGLSTIASGIGKYVDSVFGKGLSIVFGVLILPLSTIYIVQVYAHIKNLSEIPSKNHTGFRAFLWICALIGLAIPAVLIAYYLTHK